MEIIMDKKLFKSILRQVVDELKTSELSKDIEIVSIASVIDELDIFAKENAFFKEQFNVTFVMKNSFYFSKFLDNFYFKFDLNKKLHINQYLFEDENDVNKACNDEFYLIAA